MSADNTYRRMARLILRDGQIWWLYNREVGDFNVGDSIANKAWGLLGGEVLASQHDYDPGPKPRGTPAYDERPQIMRFNRDHILWVMADQG